MTDITSPVRPFQAPPGPLGGPPGPLTDNAYDRWLAGLKRQARARRFAAEVEALARAKVAARRTGKTYAVCWYAPELERMAMDRAKPFRLALKNYKPKHHQLIGIVGPERAMPSEGTANNGPDPS